MGGQAGRLAPAPGLVLEVVLLAVQGLQPGFGVAPAALVLGQRNHAGEVGLGEPLDLLAQRGPAAAQVGPARLQLLRQPVPAARPRHRARAIISGAASTSHRSRQTSSSSARAGT
jgi:hypothetical protein